MKMKNYCVYAIYDTENKMGLTAHFVTPAIIAAEAQEKVRKFVEENFKAVYIASLDAWATDEVWQIV